VLNRLHEAGFNAFLVGGCVRDLLLRRAPKDFDVATDAKPHQIKKLFHNSNLMAGILFNIAHHHEQSTGEISGLDSISPLGDIKICLFSPDVS